MTGKSPGKSPATPDREAPQQGGTGGPSHAEHAAQSAPDSGQGATHTHGMSESHIWSSGDLSAIQRAITQDMDDDSDSSGSRSSSDAWQITYLDTITLLLILFILLSAFQPLTRLPSGAETPASFGRADGAGVSRDVMGPVDLAPPMMELTPRAIVPPVIVGPAGLTDRAMAGLTDSNDIDFPPDDFAADGFDGAGSDGAQVPDGGETPTDSARNLGDRVAALIADRNLEDSVDMSMDAATVSIQMRDSLLFASGQADLSPEGATVLTGVAPLLSTIDGLISVEGHTDPVPINTARFPSNWDLSTARAVSVVRSLIDDGVAAETLRAVGHADTRPIDDNATAEGRARNRRVTIMITLAAEDAGAL